MTANDDSADENHGTCERAFVGVELGVWHRDKLDFYYYFLRLIFICLHHAVTCNGIVECKTPVQVSGTVEHHRQAMEMRSIIGGMPLGEFGAEVGVGVAEKINIQSATTMVTGGGPGHASECLLRHRVRFKELPVPFWGTKNPSMCLFSRRKCTLPLLTGWNLWELMDTTECGFTCEAVWTGPVEKLDLIVYQTD